jgi:hypothetical protein
MEPIPSPKPFEKERPVTDYHGRQFAYLKMIWIEKGPPSRANLIRPIDKNFAMSSIGGFYLT